MDGHSMTVSRDCSWSKNSTMLVADLNWSLHIQEGWNAFLPHRDLLRAQWQHSIWRAVLSQRWDATAFGLPKFCSAVGSLQQGLVLLRGVGVPAGWLLHKGVEKASSVLHLWSVWKAFLISFRKQLSYCLFFLCSSQNATWIRENKSWLPVVVCEKPWSMDWLCLSLCITHLA